MYLYLMAFVVVGYSGINYFTDQADVIAALLVLLASIFVFFKPSPINDRTLWFLLAFIVILFFQSLAIELISPYYYLRTLLFVLMVPLLLVKILPHNYNDYIIKLVYIWTILALLIWLATQLDTTILAIVRSLPDQLQLDPYESRRKSFIIYTYERQMEYGINRFAGFWHEPGAFAVLMGYCLFFNTIRKNSLYNKENLVFLLAIIVTLSTTAYFAVMLAAALFLFYFFRGKIVLKVAMYFFLLIGAYYAFINFEFLGEKLEEQMEYQMTVELEGTPTYGRILGFRKSMNKMFTYPMFGRGLSTQTQADFESAIGGGYGWPSFFSRVGLPMGVLLAVLFYRGMQFYTRFYQADMRYVPVFFALLAILLFSQKHTSSVMFMMLMMTPLVYPKYFSKDEK